MFYSVSLAIAAVNDYQGIFLYSNMLFSYIGKIVIYVCLWLWLYWCNFVLLKFNNMKAIFYLSAIAASFICAIGIYSVSLILFN